MIGKRTIGHGFLLVLLLFGNSQVTFAEEPIPEIIVVGQRTGGTAKCASSGCMAAFQGLRMNVFLHLVAQGQHAEIEEVEVPDAQFCSALDDTRPNACNPFSQPATPMYPQPIYTTNGCGSSGSSALEAGLLAIAGSNSALNEPVVGVPFTSACDAHDTCYGFAVSRSACDAAFEEDLNAICNQVGIPSTRSNCFDAADGYSTMMESFGQDAYDAGRQKRECAIWHEEMEENNCPK